MGEPNWDLKYVDFPTAWWIQGQLKQEDHDPKCSSVPGHHPLSGPGLLCDCGAISRYWEKRTGLKLDTNAGGD